MADRPRIFTAADPWPDFGPGTVVAVNYGSYRNQEIWVACGSNIGNWYPLGSPYGRPRVAEDTRNALEKLSDPRFRQPPGTVPLHPHWEDIVRRGPVTLLVAAQADAYQAGWSDGRRRLVEQFEELCENEDDAPIAEEVSGG